MIRWEYMFHSAKQAEFIRNDMNKFGKDGWELVHFEKHTDPITFEMNIQAYFKRSLPATILD